MNNILLIGVVGLGITFGINLAGVLLLEQPAAEFFSDDWWSV